MTAKGMASNSRQTPVSGPSSEEDEVTLSPPRPHELAIHIGKGKAQHVETWKKKEIGVHNSQPRVSRSSRILGHSCKPCKTARKYISLSESYAHTEKAEY